MAALNRKKNVMSKLFVLVKKKFKYLKKNILDKKLVIKKYFKIE